MRRSSTGMVAAVFFCGGLLGCREAAKPVASPDAPALAVRNEAGTGPVQFVTELSADSITTLDALTYRMTLRIGPGYEADFPDIYNDEHLAGFIVTARRERDETAADGTRFVIRDYELEPEYTGDMTLGAVHVYYYEKGAIAEQELVTEPLTVTVAADEVASTELVGVRDLVTVAEFEARHRRIWPWGLGIGLGGAALIGAAVWLVRRPRPGPPPPAAHEVAMDALRALVAQELVEQGEVERFFVLLTAIVREYIEEAFGVRAPEQTTEEFLQNVATAPAIAAHRAALEPFLQVADEVKFAKLEPDPAMIQRAFDTARDFIQKTADAPGEMAISPQRAAADARSEAA